MVDSEKAQPKWDRATTISVTVLIVLVVGGLFSIVAVAGGWLDEPRSPDGTYPPGPRGGNNFSR